MLRHILSTRFKSFVSLSPTFSVRTPFVTTILIITRGARDY